jgi:HSP20 family protein
MKPQRKEVGTMTTTYLQRILDPWREFDRMGRLMNRTARCGTCEFPAVNVWVNGENAEISSEIPGIDREAIDISVSGNTVTVRGSRPTHERKEDESWHRHEIRHGDFSKTIQLPFNIDASKVHASYNNGVLHVSLPQLEADKPKKISIKSE